MVLWEGRFKKKIDPKTNDFNSSIKFDNRLYREDIEGSIAHCTMLGKQNIISKEDSKLIIEELKNILSDIETDKLKFDENAEDIHMFIESELTKRIGDAGKRLHTARSRNDQIALDIKMYLKKEINEIINLVKQLIVVLLEKAEANLDTIMPGYTHMQRAQPITFAHYLMAYVEMFLRDIDRLKDTFKRTDTMPLGSSALAGTTFNIDRNMVKDLLGFKEITKNSLDGVSDRDYIIEFSSDISIMMMHLSRLSEEIIMWCSWEFKFIELDDAFSTGSSIMPQKKNPDIAELIRGKTGRVYGNLIQILTTMKALPLAYNKDMQEDKEGIFDTIDTIKLCITTIIPMIKTFKVLKNNMREAAKKGFINATDCADYLTKKQVPFRKAYKIVGNLVSYCIDNNKTLEDLTIEEYKNVDKNFEKDIYKAIKLEECVKNRNIIGGPSPEIVENRIKEVKTLVCY